MLTAPSSSSDLLQRQRLGPGMRVFVYEYTCGGGLMGTAPGAALRGEGWAMLRAVLDDLGRVPGVATATMLEVSLDRRPERGTIHWIGPDQERNTFLALARACDFSLVIAPE